MTKAYNVLVGSLSVVTQYKYVAPFYKNIRGKRFR